MNVLPAGLEETFLVAAGELGLCSASWLFVRELAAAGGRPLLEQLREELGRSFPVLDAVASTWLEGRSVPRIDIDAVVEACGSASRVLIVGIEALHLDALVSRLESTRIFLLTHRLFEVDWPRVIANFNGRVEPVSLTDFQQWAGRRSVLLTFTYGTGSHATHVSPAWMRLIGPDVRNQFRSILGWEVLHASFHVYPRWLVEVPLHEFTQVV